MKLRLTTIFMALLACTIASKPAFAKIDVCHKTGNGTFHIISIDEVALPAHIAHGDGKPGDPIPNMEGFIFGPNCTPTVAPPPTLPIGCYNTVNIGENVDLFFFGPIDILGNINLFPLSNNGTCSGVVVPDLHDGIIAAGNAADAQSKCDALTGVPASPIFDLTGLVPSEPGFWLCTGPTGPMK